MDLMGIGLEQFSDIGFALLVGGICLRTLLFDREANVKQRAVWKHELMELEKSLKQLILESTDVCEAFERKLDMRQKNVEALIERAEIKSSELFAKVTVASNSSKTAPNVKKEKIQVEKKIDWEFGDELPDELPSHLAASIETTEDVTEFKAKPVESRLRENQATTQKAEPSAPFLSDEKIFSQTSIVDPIAYRIAKRLLLEGKELHVIARKLEIPVSEIRHLESLIRQNAARENAELPESFLSKEIENVTKVIRDPAVRRQPEKSLSGKIETIKDERLMLAFEQEDENASILFGR
jgi:hypothetical protein